jgi:hypothetical protein
MQERHCPSRPHGQVTLNRERGVTNNNFNHHLFLTAACEGPAEKKSYGVVLVEDAW